jgi:ABC-type multidrug transport system fused ATPase/permease subunit
MALWPKYFGYFMPLISMSIATTLKRLSPPLYRLRLFVIILAVLALPFAIYYFLYVRSQTGYFTDRSFRKLSLISSQITLKVESAGSVLKNTSDKFIRPRFVDTDSLRFNPEPGRKQENIEGLKQSFKKLREQSVLITPVNIDTEPWSEKVSPGTVTLTSVKYEGDSSWLYLDYVADGLLEKTVIRVQAKVDLNKLIQPFLSARVGSDPDQFQNIVIAESDTARVIFQHDATQIRLASLDKLPWAEDKNKKIDLKEIAQTSNVIDVSLAGSNFKLFSHPIKLSLPSSNANAPDVTWIASGLMKSNYLMSEAWSISIPYTLLIICGFLAALLVFSWPFLKLILAGPKDRFRPTDVYFLVFATIVILAVLTCFGLYGYVYFAIETQMDEQVGTLAGNIKKNFNEELKQALTQLDILSQDETLLAQLNSGSGAESQAGPLPAYGSVGSGSVGGADPRNRTNILPSLLESNPPYRYFDTVIWIGPSGMQVAKWTTKSYTTQYIPVAGRAYFDNIRQGNVYELGQHKFSLEPIVSRTTGRNVVEISKAVTGTPWIIAFDTRLLSLMDPVLPAGFGYTIIANDGKVLFHSDEAHHLGENLFQECDDNNSLRSAVIGRGDRAMNVRYLGEDHRFFITTLQGFPDWSLVVFRNKQPLRTAFFELLTTVSVLFLIYGLILMTAFTIFYLFNVVNDRRAWLWPSENKADIYRQSVFILLVLSLLSLSLTIVLHGQRVVWLIVAISFFAAFVYFVNLRWGFKSPFLKYVSGLLNRFKDTNQLYAMNVSLLLLLISILPAGAFFKYAYESEIRLFIKHAQYSVTTALAKRDARIRSRYSSTKFADGKAPESQNREAFIKQRLAEHWDVYDNFFFQTQHQSPATEAACVEDTQTDLLSSLSGIVPLSTRHSIERRGLLDNASVRGICRWESAAMGSLILHLEGSAGQSASPRLHLNTSVPLLGIPGFPVVGAVLLFVPLFLFINFIVRKVFLLDTHKPTSHSLKKLLSCKIDRNVFVVVNAPFVKKELGKESNLCLRNLPSLAAASADWADTFDYNSVSEETVIAFDEFDFGMDDPKINQQKLKLVESLLAKQRTLVIFSSADSSQYRFANGENGHASGERDETGRWAGVIISNFFTEYAEDTDDGLLFRGKVLQEKARIMATDLQGRSTEEIDELFETLYCECAPREPLQRVGLQILSQKGFVTLSREHLIGRIANQARTYYTHIWNSCSTGEKLTLCHLAQDRLLSHRDPDIEALLRRELIVRDQDLHLFNHSFRQFVKSAEKISFVAEQDKQAQQGSLWQTLKVPILVAMLAITAFLFVTQQDLFSSSLALVTGLTTLVPALLKVISMFHTDSIRE